MQLLKTSVLVLGTILTQQALAQDEAFRLDETYKIGQSGTIYLETDDANVRIKGSDRKDVHVKIYRKVTRKGIAFGEESFEVEVRPKGNDLYIRDIQQQVNVGIVGYMSEEYKITIEAPKGVSLDIDGDDDDYDIRYIDGSIRMDLDDGDVILTSCGGKSFDFDLDDGDLEMDQGAGELRISMDDGDAVIRNASFSSINATTDDGDLDIATGLVDDGDYMFRMDDGDLDLTILEGGGTFQIHHDDGNVSASQAFKVIVDEEDETELKLANGKALVKMRADDSRVRLREI